MKYIFCSVKNDNKFVITFDISVIGSNISLLLDKAKILLCFFSNNFQINMKCEAIEFLTATNLPYRINCVIVIH